MNKNPWLFINAFCRLQVVASLYLWIRHALHDWFLRPYGNRIPLKILAFACPLMVNSCILFGQEFYVGASAATINPENDSLYFAGAERNRKFIDTEDNLYVKAVVISGSGTDMAILTFDCIGLMFPELEKIRRRVQILLPDFPIENIVISSTHTHTGPDVVGLWGKDMLSSGVNDLFMKTLIEKSAQTISEAWQNRTKCTILTAEGQTGETWVKNISEPELIDRTVSVLQFKDTQGKNIATLTNFACHPTILIGVTKGGSADYVAGYYQYLDAIQGGVNMFLQGAIGGWVQPEDVPRRYENAMKYGTELGEYTYKLLRTGKSGSSSALKIKVMKLNLPVKNEGFRQLSQAGVISRKFTDSVSSELACFRIGDALFATHPGETSPALSLYTRSLMKNKGPKFILGLGMDALGYILKPVYFVPKNSIPHSPYLTSMSIGPDTYPEIEKKLQTVLQEFEED